HDHDAVLIADDDVARANRRARANDLDVDRPRTGFDRTLGRDGFRPYRKTHLSQIGYVTHARVDHESHDSMRAARGRQQLAEHAVGRFGGRGDDQRVARPADFDRGMDHQIITGLTRYSDRRRRHASRQINRAHVRTHQPRAALRLVYGGDALKTERFDQL